MLKGTLFILSACLVWGMIFVIPGFLEGFSPLEVALNRCFFFGIISCTFLLVKGLHHWKQIPRVIWRQALIYSILVNVLYYISLVLGLRYSSAAVIALLAGISPIAISFYGNWTEKNCSFKKLILPSLLIGCGLVSVNWEAFMLLPPSASISYVFGLFCGIFSLATWVWYVVSNSRFLKQHPTLSYSDWATIMGSMTLFWVLLISVVFFTFTPSEELQKFAVWDQKLLYFILGGVVLGFVCSWLGSFLWNIGCQALPISLAGQLSIFETIFGIVFVYLIDQHLPSYTETIGIISILFGVCLSLYLFREAPEETPSFDTIS